MTRVDETFLKAACNAGIRRLVVTPEFYVGFARWHAQEWFKREIWPEINLGYCRAMDIQLAGDDEIIERRLADNCYYRGLTIQLAKEFK